MKTYLEADVPEELCQHLFTSFRRKICQASPEAQRQSSGISQLNNLGEPALPLPPSQARRSLDVSGSLAHHPVRTKIVGWHLQWVVLRSAQGQMGPPGLCATSRRRGLYSGEGTHRASLPYSAAHSEPKSLYGGISIQTGMAYAPVTGTSVGSL